MGHTTHEQRWGIVHSWKRLQSIPATAAEQNCPLRTARHWVKRYLATGGVLDLHRSGRRPVMQVAARGITLDKLMAGQHRGAAGVSHALWESGVTSRQLHKTTIIRIAKQEAQRRGFKIRALVGKPKKKLSGATMNKRLDFCRRHLTMGWRHVMFTDRKKFAFYYPGFKVQPVSWVPVGQEREGSKVNHAAVVNVYAGLTPYGMTAVHVVAGTSGRRSTYYTKKGAESKNITSAEYKAVLTETLIPQGQKIYRNHGISSWTLQQDNDPTHKVAGDVVREYNKANRASISVLAGWPASSPDLSLIENVWAFVGARIDALGCKTFSDYQAALVAEFKAVPQDYCKRLYAGMQKRLQDCIDKDGGKTRH
jgi:hypothetical protein